METIGEITVTIKRGSAAPGQVVMVHDGKKVKTFAREGCQASCHKDYVMVRGTVEEIEAEIARLKLEVSPLSPDLHAPVKSRK